MSLGARLTNSQFTNGYETISYGRGTWLLHMLRGIMQDADAKSRHHSAAHSEAVWDEPFTRALHHLRDNFAGKPITTADLIHALEQELPPSQRFEGRKSLAWFVENWIHGTAIPNIAVKDVKISEKAGVTSVTCKIEQKDAPETLVTSIPVYGMLGRQAIYLGRVFADGTETIAHLQGPPGIRKIALDVNHSVLTSNH